MSIFIFIVLISMFRLMFPPARCCTFLSFSRVTKFDSQELLNSIQRSTDSMLTWERYQSSCFKNKINDDTHLNWRHFISEPQRKFFPVLNFHGSYFMSTLSILFSFWLFKSFWYLFSHKFFFLWEVLNSYSLSFSFFWYLKPIKC